MNGNIVVKKFDYPPSASPISIHPVDELPCDNYLVTRFKKGFEIHYNLTAFFIEKVDMALFIQKMEEDLKDLKESLHI